MDLQNPIVRKVQMQETIRLLSLGVKGGWCEELVCAWREGPNHGNPSSEPNLLH